MVKVCAVSDHSVPADKSGKKFAPKAPARRAPAAAPPRRPSAVQQPPAPQPSQPAATETATGPVPEAPTPAHEQSDITTTPSEPSVAESAPQKTSDAQSSQGATAIPIPAPKRKASISTPIPRPTASKPTAPSQPTPPPPTATASTTEPTPVPIPGPPQTTKPDDRRPDTAQEPVRDRDETIISPASSQTRPPSTGAAEIRPTKRLRTSVEHPVPATHAQPTIQPLTPPPTQTTESGETTANPEEEVESHPAPADKGRKTTKPRNRKPNRTTTGENGTGGERQKRPRARQKREPTPEGADAIEIAPTAMKMSDLCKDMRTGKVSKRELELRNMEAADQERKQRAQQDGESTEPTPVKQNGDAAPPAPEPDQNPENKSQAGPVMRIVNGEIVLDTASLQVDRHADATRNLGELEDVVENSLTRKINQASYGKRSKTESWDEEMTDLFYRGLRMFGTDFMMISKMFPGRSRRQIKLKFNNEERRNPGLIKDTLMGPSETIDIATYSEMTNTVYDDPKAIQQELDEEKKQIEDRHAKEKEAQEELLRNPDGADEDGKTAPGADKNNGPSAKTKQRNNKKQAKSMAGGTEEIVGSIDDFP